jgi:hypothetical protein
METLNQFQMEHRNQLTEIHDLCCFERKKDSKAFWKRVFEAGEVESGEPVSQDSFEMCLIKAKDLLFNEGRKIFTRKKTKFNPRWFKVTRAGQFRNI